MAIDAPQRAWIADNQINLTLTEREIVAQIESVGWQVSFPVEPRLYKQFGGTQRGRLCRLLLHGAIVALPPAQRYDLMIEAARNRIKPWALVWTTLVLLQSIA